VWTSPAVPALVPAGEAAARVAEATTMTPVIETNSITRPATPHLAHLDRPPRGTFDPVAMVHSEPLYAFNESTDQSLVHRDDLNR